MKGALAVYGTTMVGMPAPAIVGKSVGLLPRLLEEPVEVPEELDAVFVPEEESVVVADVDAAVLLEDDSEVDSAVERALLLVDSSSSSSSLRSGRSSLSACAFTTGATPARANSAKS